MGHAGIERHVHDLAHEQSKRHKVAVAACAGKPDGPDVKIDHDKGVEIYWVKGRSDENRNLTPRCNELESRVQQVMELSAPEIVHIHHLAGLSTQFVSIAREFGAIVIVSLHDYTSICPNDTIDWNGRLCFSPGKRCFHCLHPDPYSRRRAYPYWRLTNYLLIFLANHNLGCTKFLHELSSRKDAHFSAMNNANRIIAPSAAIAEVFQMAGIEPEKISVIGHGVMTSAIQAADKNGEPIRFGFIGSNRTKGLEVLLKAWRNIPVEEAELHIYGSLSYPWIDLVKIRRLSDTNNIHLHGAYEPNEIDAVYSSIDVLVAPSVWIEPFGLVAAEAIVRGIPVIASDIGGFRDVVRDEINGILVPYRDSEKLNEAMCRYIRQKELRESLKNGCGVARTISDQARDIDSVYSDCLSQTRGACDGDH